MTAPFDLNLRHLRAVIAIAGCGSMSAAAEAVSLSQPAVTQGLAKIEGLLGSALFDRLTTGMTITPDGEIVRARTEAAFGHLSAAARSVSRGGARGFSRAELLMTSTQLRAFLAVADCGSFAAAAIQTGLSQPAVHRSVRDLEQLCAAPLAERRGRTVALTAPGLRLARGIRLARAELAALVSEVCGPAEGSEALLIGAMPLCRASILPQALARFTREHPGVKIDIIEGSWRELVDPLRDGVLDLMIGALRDSPPPDCRQAPLTTDRLAVIGGPAHPLAGDPSPDLDALSRYPWIVGQPGTPLRAEWEALFQGREPPPSPIECGSVMVIRGLLGNSDFLTLLSPEQVALEIQSGVLSQIGPRLDDSVRTVGVTVRELWRPTATQARFIDLLHDVTS